MQVVEHCHRVGAVKRQLVGEHLVQNHTERKNVRAQIHFLAAGLFRRHAAAEVVLRQHLEVRRELLIEIALEVASLLARRLYYTTSYLVDLQQQSAGRREDLDLVDKILAQLSHTPDEPKGKSR